IGPMAGPPLRDGATDGWDRLTPGERTIGVHAIKAGTVREEDPEGTMYVRVPGAKLKEGARRKYRFVAEVMRPKVGKEYQLTLGKARFSFIVESGEAGTQYAIGYGGETHTYLLGLPAAATRVDAIADLDGDGIPDFLVEVGDETYLLLSTQAHAGANRPSAQLWNCGC